MTTPKPALPEPVPPNAEGSTTCIVRWMVTTRDGLWLGAWDKEAFAAYTQFAIDAAVAEARAEMQERIADQLRTIKALMVGMPDEGTTPVIRRIAWLEQQLAEARAVPADWADQVEQRLLTWRQRMMNRSGDRLALDDFMGQDSIDDLIDFVCAPLAATPSPAEQTKPAVRAEKLYDAIKEVLLHHRLSYTEGEDAEAFPLVDMLCPPGSRDISKGRDEITLICDAIYNDEAVRAAISGEQP